MTSFMPSVEETLDDALPLVTQDPAYIKATTAHTSYTSAVEAIRDNAALTDLDQAQRVVDTWTKANADITSAYQDIQARRRDRISTLEAIVPLGPNIPANASPADTAVLQQAFRGALTTARNAQPNDLAKMLVDAERFDDDTLRRAVLTAAMEADQVHVIQNWAVQRGLAAHLTELAAMREAVAGRGLTGLFDAQAFGAIPAPDEVSLLPNLIAAQQAKIDAIEKSRRTRISSSSR